MNAILPATNQPAGKAVEMLPALIDRAVTTLTNARTSAEILEAREIASFAYDVAKKAARLAKAKRAHDSLIASAHRTQANALEIEAQAKRRLADEYDAAQERGEVGQSGTRTDLVAKRNEVKTATVAHLPATAADVGLTRKDIHEAREVRDAEETDPGIVRRTLDEAIESGEEPTRAKIKRAVKAKSKRARRPRGHMNVVEESQHDRDLRMLLGVWEVACDSAQAEFLKLVTQNGDA